VNLLNKREEKKLIKRCAELEAKWRKNGLNPTELIEWDTLKRVLCG